MNDRQTQQLPIPRVGEASNNAYIQYTLYILVFTCTVLSLIS